MRNLLDAEDVLVEGAWQVSLVLDWYQAKMEKVEKILQGDAVMVQPSFRAMLSVTSEKVQNYQTHPTLYHQFNDVWLKG